MVSAYLKTDQVNCFSGGKKSTLSPVQSGKAWRSATILLKRAWIKNRVVEFLVEVSRRRSSRMGIKTSI